MKTIATIIALAFCGCVTVEVETPSGPLGIGLGKDGLKLTTPPVVPQTIKLPLPQK